MNTEIRLSTTGKGKCLHAVTHIAKDAVIFEEIPLVSCQFSWNETCMYKACNHCLRPLETAEENVRRLTGNSSWVLPYPQCCTTKKEDIIRCPDCSTEYCSENCKTLAFDEYHKTICSRTLDDRSAHPIIQLQEAWKQIHYPPETSSIFLMVRLLAKIIQAPNTEEAIETTLSFCHRSVNEDAELAHKFLGKKFSHQVNLLRELIANALPNPKVQQFLTQEGFQSLVALIGTNGQGVGSSPFSSWIRNVEKLNLSAEQKEQIDSLVDRIYDEMYSHTGDFLNSEGVGLYARQSCANHSCDPNAEISFVHNNYRLSLIALKDIQPGEEICISYLGDCDNERSRHSRRKTLMENYLFACECSKCLAEIDDPDVTSEEEMSAEEDD
uniref:SET domain-containing protein n=1 Tax=Dendroctonus ponderosae TaxID=77166 RepID=J3JU04_DENPD|nr:unknown [Dendroctonus ponderosae]